MAAKNIVAYQDEYFGSAPSIEDFLDSLRCCNLTYLASALLEEGFPPTDIVEAVRRATLICRTAGVPVADHFKPIYSGYRGTLIRDCKLSHFGYMLTILNARPENAVTALTQTGLLKHLL